MLLASQWFVALAVSSIRPGIGTTRAFDMARRSRLPAALAGTPAAIAAYTRRCFAAKQPKTLKGSS